MIAKLRVLGGREQRRLRYNLNHRSVQRVWVLDFIQEIELLSLWQRITYLNMHVLGEGWASGALSNT